MSTVTLKINSWGEIKLDKNRLRRLMRSAAGEIAKEDQALIGRIAGNGRFYTYNGNRYQASAPGEPPVRRSGTMQQSVKGYTYRSGEGFAVREREFYALFLETGTFPPGVLKKYKKQGTRPPAGTKLRMEPRPHLSAVMKAQAQPLMDRVNKAMTEGLTWRQTR